MAAAAPARAEPAFQWRAPDACPDERDARGRVERRLGEPLDGFVVGIAVAIDVDLAGYVAHVGGRTLRGETCDELTDAVALVVARLATEAPRRVAAAVSAAPAPPPVASGADVPPAWGGGLRGSWLTGIGGVPSIGLGGEIAGYVRRDRLVGEVAWADWARGGGVVGPEFGLAMATVRVGWAPAQTAIRGWLGVDVGAMTGLDPTLVARSQGSTTWVAVGPGVAVAWPMAPRWRLVGTFEVLAALTRARVTDGGMTLYEQSPVAARTTLGLEVGWR